MNTVSKPKRRLTFLFVLIIGTTVTWILMNAFTFLDQHGLFYAWTSLGSPPSGAAHIINGDPFQAWVKANDGQIYTNPFCNGAQICPQWILEEDLSSFGDAGPDRKRGTDCESLNNGNLPLNPGGKMIECLYVPMDGETYFALMADGSIQYYQLEIDEDIKTSYKLSTYFCPPFAAILITVSYVIYRILKNIRLP
jgi:hypothetical protein